MVDSYYIRPKALSALAKEEQLVVMEEWFRRHFETPDFHTPYDSEDGRYVFLDGGPFDAADELVREFDGLVPAKVIEELAQTLTHESDEWAPIPGGRFFVEDESPVDFHDSRIDTIKVFALTIETIRRLGETSIDSPLGSHLRLLLYANVVTTLETYLSDTFMNSVLSNPGLLRVFFESNKDFKDRKISYDAIFKEVDRAREEAVAYLARLVWHRLPKVRELYRAVLGISLDKGIGAIDQAVKTRHAIVHKNGITVDGRIVEIAVTDLAALIENAEQFVRDIEEQLIARTNERADSDF